MVVKLRSWKKLKHKTKKKKKNELKKSDFFSSNALARFLFRHFSKDKKTYSSVLFPAPRTQSSVSIIRTDIFKLIRLHFQCKINIAKKIKILVKINIDKEVVKRIFNFKSMKQNWIIWINQPFIIKYAEGCGFKFYLTMQLLAIQSIKNTFSNNFVRHKSCDTQNCKKVCKTFLLAIS